MAIQIKSVRVLLFVACASLALGSVAYALFGGAARTADGATNVPTLTSWGKIFALLLLVALGVAYLVWRRPIMQAQAILETSPLGSSQAGATPLVDWVLCLKFLVLIEIAAGGAILAWGKVKQPLATIDALGVLTSGVILAFVLHLLWLGRRGGSNRRL